MDKLSELIKEAKPLYKAQKRNKAIAKMMVCLCLPVMFFSLFASIYMMGDDIYVSMNNSNISEELLYDDFGLVEVK